jgi:hypothetical protein
VNTLGADVIKISFSSPYELSLFSSKASSAHGGSSGVSVGDLCPEIDSTEGATVTTTAGPVEASTSRPLSGTGATSRGKTVISSRGLRYDDAPQQASERASVLKKKRGGGSAKDKATKILADLEAGTSRLELEIRSLKVDTCF